MNFLKTDVYFRYATFEDLFEGNMNSCSSRQSLKENVEFFVFDNGVLKERRKTRALRFDTSFDFYEFNEVYQLVLFKKAMVLCKIAMKDITHSVFLRKATKEDLGFNSYFYYYENKTLSGPFIYSQNYNIKNLQECVENGKIFIFEKIVKVDTKHI